MASCCNKFDSTHKVPRKFLTYAPFVLLLLLISACATPAPATNLSVPADESLSLSELPKNDDGYVDISVDQLASLMEDKTFTLVNVHIPYEGELPQTDAFIAFDEIAAHTDELPAQDAPIVLYCRSGSMSTEAARVLADMGYENIVELDGGFNAWKAAGYEFIDQR